MKQKPVNATVLARLLAIGNEEWAEIIGRLTVFAANRASRLTFYGGTGGMPGGKDIEEVVFDAIESVWLGERLWDPDRVPDLLQFLKGVVYSRLGHLVSSAAHRMAAPNQTVDELSLAAGTPDPLDDAHAKEVAERIRRCAQHDTDLIELLDLYAQGIRGKDAAAQLRVSPGEIYARVRRLRRILQAEGLGRSPWPRRACHEQEER